MKRLLSLGLAIFLSLSLFAGIAPSSLSLGRVVVEVEEGSVEEKILKAFREEFSEAWLSEYTVNTEAFALAYVPLLSSILPMENIIISAEENNRLSLYSRKSGYRVSLILENGLISALGAELI